MHCFLCPASPPLRHGDCLLRGRRANALLANHNPPFDHTTVACDGNGEAQFQRCGFCAGGFTLHNAHVCLSVGAESARGVVALSGQAEQEEWSECQSVKVGRGDSGQSRQSDEEPDEGTIPACHNLNSDRRQHGQVDRLQMSLARARWSVSLPNSLATTATSSALTCPPNRAAGQTPADTDTTRRTAGGHRRRYCNVTLAPSAGAISSRAAPSLA